MARPGLTQNRKFRRLGRRLGSQIIARGALELMWDTAYESGDSYLGDSEDVEASARWNGEGEPGKLTKALLEAGGDSGPGFIEEVPGKPGHYQVHDLWHHVPDYVRKRRAREAERRAKTDPAGETESETADTDRSRTGQRQPSPDCQDGVSLSREDGVDRTPAPAPAPDIKTKPPSKPESGFDHAVEEIFQYFVTATHKNRRLYLLSQPRKTKIRGRLEFCRKLAKDRSPENAVALAKVAIDRFAASPFHNGQNEKGKKYLDVDLLFRGDDYFAKWLDDQNFPQAVNQ